jgi:type IV fimbrial biogenesis protein FimT
MLNTSRTYRRIPAGFSLIELMVTLALLAMLMIMAVPGFKTWIANTKIRTTADSIQNGLMLAKAEAIRRNAKVQFILTASDPTAANVNSAAYSTSGSGWMVRVYQSTGTYTTGDYVQGRSSAEGGTGVSVSTTHGYPLIFTGVGTLLTTSSGSSTPAVPGSAITIVVKNSAVSGTRTLNIVLKQGGSIRMCDFNLPSTSPMGC